MITTGKISASAIAILDATACLRRAVMFIERFATAAQIFKKAAAVANISSAAPHVQLTGGNPQGALQTPTIPSSLVSAAVAHRKAEERSAAEPSSVTANAGARASLNRLGIDASSVKAPGSLATGFSFFYKILKPGGKPNASDTLLRKDDVQHKPATPTLNTAYERFLHSWAALEGASIAAIAPTLARALEDIASGLDWLTRAAQHHSAISAAVVAIPATVLALIGLGGTHRFVLTRLRPFFFIGLRDVSWLLRKLGVTGALRWLGRLVITVVEFGTMLARLWLGWYLVIAEIAVGGHELYRHWGAVKRLLSLSVDSAHKAVARLLKWLYESAGTVIPFASGAIVAVKPANRNVPRFSAARAATARGMDRAYAVEHAATVVRPAPMLRAVRRAAAAAAFATPLMLTTGLASAFATPLILSADTARIAAPLPAMSMTQGPIVINYAPNVVIHSEDAADIATFKRRVMEVLERHGRELHQVLAREIVRQQRREFNPLLSDQ
jgi:hypothetical protein